MPCTSSYISSSKQYIYLYVVDVGIHDQILSNFGSRWLLFLVHQSLGTWKVKFSNSCYLPAFDILRLINVQFGRLNAFYRANNKVQKMEDKSSDHEK